MKRKDLSKTGASKGSSLLTMPALKKSKNKKSNNQTSKHMFRLERDGKVGVDNAGGSIKIMNGEMFPILDGLTFYIVDMKKGGLREPHWHPNANELNIVIRGKAKLGVLSADNTREEQVCGPGDTFFIPMGYFHYIENVHDGDTKLIVAFSNANPEDLGIGAAYGFLSDKMLGETFDTKPSNFKGIPKPSDSFLMMGKKK
jgi:oxalate decarboxylase